MHEETDIKAGHGFTHKQLAELQRNQIQGEVKSINANNAGDKIGDEYFKKAYHDYQIPEHDAGFYHVACEARLFDPQSGKKISKPRVNVYHEKMFEKILDEDGFRGVTTHILHHPHGAQAAVSDEPDAPQETVEDRFKAAKKKDEFLAVYKEVFGEDADKDLTIAELTEAVEDEFKKITNEDGEAE